MIRIYLLLGLLCLSCPLYGQVNYLAYHQAIIQVEESIVKGEYAAALKKLEHTFSTYDFVFVRDYKIACQLALAIGQKDTALKYLEKAVQNGWAPKEIKRNKFLSQLPKDPRWKVITSKYDKEAAARNIPIETSLRSQVREMFKLDQRKALAALFRIGNKAKERYNEQIFAPHSELQLAKFAEIIETYGYPGEKLIANNVWMSTIISHHNSISQSYVQQDTLYPGLRPLLLKAIEKGELSPFEFALMEDWKVAVENEHQSTAFGFIGSISSDASLIEINRNRSQIGMRSIELRNALVEVEEATAMKLYLPGSPWQAREIQLDER